MAIKNVIAKGIGFTPGSISFIPTHGFSIGVATVTTIAGVVLSLRTTRHDVIGLEVQTHNLVGLKSQPTEMVGLEAGTASNTEC